MGVVCFASTVLDPHCRTLLCCTIRVGSVHYGERYGSLVLLTQDVQDTQYFGFSSSDCARVLYRRKMTPSADCVDKNSMPLSASTEAAFERLERLLLAYLKVGTSPTSILINPDERPTKCDHAWTFGTPSKLASALHSTVIREWTPFVRYAIIESVRTAVLRPTQLLE